MNNLSQKIMYGVLILLGIAVVYVLYVKFSSMAAILAALGIGGKVVNDSLNKQAERHEAKLEDLNKKQEELKRNGVEDLSAKEEEDYWKKQ